MLFRSNGAAATSGSGLGLAIARDVMQQHGGEIQLKPSSKGQGLRSEILLRRTEAAA